MNTSGERLFVYHDLGPIAERATVGQELCGIGLHMSFGVTTTAAFSESLRLEIVP